MLRHAHFVSCLLAATLCLGGCSSDETSGNGGPQDGGDYGDGGDVTPDGTTEPNACGGDAPLEAEPGDPCGPCGVDTIVCDGTNAVACDDQTTECWAQVATGNTHTCALHGDGTLWCWGDGADGRLGNGYNISTNWPVQVVAAEESEEDPWNDWVAVTAGQMHSCGLRADGTAWCWGRGQSGQRGDASTDDERDTPTQVLVADAEAGGDAWDDWTAIVTGSHTTCGIRGAAGDGGTLWCWGNGVYGRRGDGTFHTHRPTPRQVVAAEESEEDPWDDWTSVAGGQFHTCGLRSNGTLWCWGHGGDGRRGDGTDDGTNDGRRNTPIQVLAAGEDEGGATWNDWVEVVAGHSHSCGRRADDTVWCWGAGSAGRIGDGTIDQDRLAPVQVVAAGEGEGGATWNDWAGLAARAGAHTCGRRRDHTLWCWGGGQEGKLGDGTEGLSREAPVQVLAAGEDEGGATWNDWTGAAASTGHTCGIRADGSLWCWGRADSGELGDGDPSTDPRPTPAEVELPTPVEVELPTEF